ncbi:MAG: hypothetical protein ACMUJM_21380 [bacterium]
MEEGKKSFSDYLKKRLDNEETEFFKGPPIQKAYYIGAYARAVINSSYYSEVSKNNTTYKTWLSNQIINYRNLDRIFEMAFRFEQKLKLKIKNDSEVRRLAHEVPPCKSTGISSARISFAFVAGFDDYNKFTKDTLPETAITKGEIDNNNL